VHGNDLLVVAASAISPSILATADSVDPATGRRATIGPRILPDTEAPVQPARPPRLEPDQPLACAARERKGVIQGVLPVCRVRPRLVA
jgi:hypothetical protein